MPSLRRTPHVRSAPLPAALGACLLAWSLSACGGSEGPTTPTTPTATCNVTGLSVAPAQGTLLVGDTLRLGAAVAQTGCSATAPAWQSSRPDVVQVSSAGMLTALAPGGPVTITARYGDATGSGTFTVLARVASVGIAPAGPVSLQTGQTQRFSAAARDAGGTELAGRTITWTSANSAVMTIASDGLAAAVAPGQTVLTATCEGKSASVAVTVTAATAAAVASLTVSPTTLGLTVGQTSSLAATPRDAQGGVLTGRAVAWTTSAAGVATVTSDGTVSGIAAGQATITATSEGKSGTAVVTVTAPTPAPVASVVVAPATATLTVGQSQTFTAAARDGQGNTLAGRAVTWATSNPGVVSVTASGVATAVAVGQATVTASVEGKTGSATVTVSAPTPNTVTLAITNQLLYPVNISSEGTTLGSVPAQSTRSATITAGASVRVTFDLVQPAVGGRTLGDPMSGYWDLTNPSGTVSLTVDNVVGSQAYFAPVVTNTTGVALLMAVNWGLASENRCNCTAPANGASTGMGYYRLYSNSTVAAFRDGTNYTGNYRIFSALGASVPRGSGRLALAFNVAP